MAHTVSWNSAFDATPAGTDDISGGDDRIRELKTAVSERLDLEHYFDKAGTNDWQGIHTPPYVTKTAEYTAAVTDEIINCTSGTFTLYLPAVASVPTGKQYLIKNSGTGTITVNADAAETIDGELTQVLDSQYAWIRLVNTGSAWVIAARNPRSTSVTLADPTFTGTVTNTAGTIKYGSIISNIKPPQGFMINGTLEATIGSGSLTVAIKTHAGTNPSATDPVYVNINGTVRTISASLSIILTLSTNWFGSGGGAYVALSREYYVGLVYVSSAVQMVVTPFPLDFASGYDGYATPTYEGFMATSTGADITYAYNIEWIGMFTATMDAGYAWTAIGNNVLRNPWFFGSTQTFNYGTTVGWSGTPTSNLKYKVYPGIVDIFVTISGTSDNTAINIAGPTPTILKPLSTGVCMAVDATTTNCLGVYRYTSSTIDVYKDVYTGAWTNSGTKTITGLHLRLAK